MPRGDASTRDLPRWIPAVFLLSSLAWGVTSLLEGREPPKRVSRVRWVPPAEVDAARPVLFVFSAEWCEPCKNLDESLEEEAVVEVLNRRVSPVHIVDRKHEDGENRPEVQAVLDRYEVSSFPTLVLQPPGEGKARVRRGFLRPEEIVGLVEP